MHVRRSQPHALAGCCNVTVQRTLIIGVIIRVLVRPYELKASDKLPKFAAMHGMQCIITMCCGPKVKEHKRVRAKKKLARMIGGG
jgi:hypothetical protein